jgi:hypothetical protein
MKEQKEGNKIINRKKLMTRANDIKREREREREREKKNELKVN